MTLGVFARALSLDVVAGALCGGLLAEHVANARMRPGWWVALLAAVWSIYTGDHLLDARRAFGVSGSYRHEFHRRHARALTIALGFAVVAGLGAALTLRPAVQIYGIGLSIAVVLYLASAQGLILRSVPKEPIAGLLYAAGIWGGPIVMGEGPRAWLWLAAGLHAIAAVLNLLMLGVFEAQGDREQGSRSVALRWGSGRTRIFVIALGVVGAVLTVALGLMAPKDMAPVCVVLAMQLATPAMLLLARVWSTRNERYRIWGDSVFFLGALPRLMY
ncbi:MAG: hypothetical protein ABI672_03420 [Vicinamibacteria bacterium]